MNPSPTSLVQEMYRHYARRDFAAVFATLSPTIEVTQTPELPWGGRFMGHAGARQFFARLAEHTEALPEPRSFIEAGSEVAVTGRLRGKARLTGKPIDLEIVHIWSLHEGKVTAFSAYIDTPAMLAALTPTGPAQPGTA